MATPNRSRSAAKQFDWAGAFIARTQINTGVATQFNLFTADRAETLVRFRGEVNCSIAAPAALDAALVTFGLIVISAASVLAVSPATDPNANWLWHQYVPLDCELAPATAAARLWEARTVVDNKAMRKLREGEQIALVVENTNLIGGPAIKVSGAFRGLAMR